MAEQFKNFIDGQWQDSESKQTMERRNPANTDEIVSIIPRSNKNDVDKAVNAARAAFPKWKNIPAPHRADILYKAARILEEKKEELAEFMCREMGKILQECLGDVQEGVDIGYYMAGEGRRLHGQTVPSELKSKHIWTVREPLGVFALITPWNFPIAIPSWKIFPALVCGNSVVFKPSNFVAGSATKLVEIFEKARLPKGVLNLVHGSGGEAGDFLINHGGIDGCSFTGSTAIGKMVGKICGEKLIKHSLEMGGKNAIIVMDDANLDLAVDGALWGGFGTSGQRCTAASRVIVHEKVYDKFKDKFVKAVKQIRLGDGLKNGTHVGPVVNDDQRNSIKKYLDLAKNDKLMILCGGNIASGSGLDKGYFIEPTVIDNPPRDHKIANEEIFGPVVALLKAKDFDDAICLANNTAYGLSSAIFTESIRNAHKAAEALETGLVYVNAATIGAEVQTPFGGIKGTGNGHREAGGMGGALDTYTEIKVINVDFSGSVQKAQGIKWD